MPYSKLPYPPWPSTYIASCPDGYIGNRVGMVGRVAVVNVCVKARFTIFPFLFFFFFAPWSW